MTSAVLIALFFIVPAAVAALAVVSRNQTKELQKLNKRVNRLAAVCKGSAKSVDAVEDYDAYIEFTENFIDSKEK